MGITILEALRNAEFNLTYNNNNRSLGLDQLKNAITLLSKGYGANVDIDALLDAHGSVDNVPDKSI